MALQVLCMQISLGTVRAGKLSISILLGNGSLARRSSSRGSRSSGRAREDTASALGPHHVGGLVPFRKHGLLRHQGTLGIRRVHPRLRDAGGRHRSENGGGPTNPRRWCRRNRLVRCRGGRRGHHIGGGGILLLRVRVIAHDRAISATTSTVLGRRRRIACHVVGVAVTVRRVGCSRRRCLRPRVMRIAAVRGLLHLLVVWLERRQRLRGGCCGLLL